MLKASNRHPPYDGQQWFVPLFTRVVKRGTLKTNTALTIMELDKGAFQEYGDRGPKPCCPL